MNVQKEKKKWKTHERWRGSNSWKCAKIHIAIL